MAYTPPVQPVAESAASRYNRDYEQIPVAVSSGTPGPVAGTVGTWNGFNDDDRKDRTLDQQTDERLSRRYVNSDTWKSNVNDEAPHGEGYLGEGYYTSSDPIVKGSPFPQGASSNPA